MHTDVPSLGDEYSDRKQHEERGGAGPAVRGEGGGLVEVGLEYLQRVNKCSQLAADWRLTYSSILCRLGGDGRERGVWLGGVHGVAGRGVCDARRRRRRKGGRERRIAAGRADEMAAVAAAVGSVGRCSAQTVGRVVRVLRLRGVQKDSSPARVSRRRCQATGKALLCRYLVHSASTVRAGSALECFWCSRGQLVGGELPLLRLTSCVRCRLSPCLLAREQTSAHTYTHAHAHAHAHAQCTR